MRGLNGRAVYSSSADQGEQLAQHRDFLLRGEVLKLHNPSAYSTILVSSNCHRRRTLNRLLPSNMVSGCQRGWCLG